MRVVVTGANRGLGLEFVRQYLAEDAIVYGGCRDPESAIELNALSADYPDSALVLEWDITKVSDTERAAAAIREKTDAIDLLINNAGVMGSAAGTYGTGDPPLDRLDPDTVAETLRVNAASPLVVTARFRGLLAASGAPRVVNVSSGMGSLSRKNSSGYYAYCASKAALNMFTRLLAAELRSDRIAVMSFDPGWVRTRMGGQSASLSPEESVRGMREVIAGATLDDTGRFLNRSGQEVPW